MPTLFGQRQIQIQASRENWQRPRQGQGGGKEYAYASLPTGVQAALALRWWAAEVEDDKGVMQKAKDGDLPSLICAGMHVAFCACQRASRLSGANTWLR